MKRPRPSAVIHNILQYPSGPQGTADRYNCCCEYSNLAILEFPKYESNMVSWQLRRHVRSSGNQAENIHFSWFAAYFVSVIAMTRSGLPDPFTILSGAAITTAPTGGS